MLIKVYMGEHECHNFRILLRTAVRPVLEPARVLSIVYHFALLKYAVSPDMYFVSPLLLILLLSARRVFS